MELREQCKVCEAGEANCFSCIDFSNFQISEAAIEVAAKERCGEGEVLHQKIWKEAIAWEKQFKKGLK
jgi:hypothetical protein